MLNKQFKLWLYIRSIQLLGFFRLRELTLRERALVMLLKRVGENVRIYNPMTYLTYLSAKHELDIVGLKSGTPVKDFMGTVIT